MFWLLLTIIAYLLFALANVGDKLVVSKFKTEPIVYAFYVGILGIVTLVLIPFGVFWPTATQFFWALIGGISFVFALFFMYKALEEGETSRAITIMGSTAPIFTLALSYLFLNERLGLYQIIAFIFLVIAIIVISWQKNQKQSKKAKRLIMYAVLSGFIFAISYVTAKYVYETQTFVSGFVWIRICGFLTALAIILYPRNGKLIKKDWQRPKEQKGGLILGIQILGGAGVIGQSYAFSIASATLVNALQAIQYAFVFIFAVLLGKKIPTLKEKLSRFLVIQKIIAIILIAIGLYFLTLT